MPPVFDRESRAAETKARVARRERLEAARKERERRRRQAEKLRVGKVEEDGSFGVRGGKVYDPDTGRVRPAAVPRSQDPRPPDTRDPITKEERREIAREQRRNRQRSKERETWREKQQREVIGGRKRGRDEVKVAGFGLPSTVLSRAARDVQTTVTDLPGGLYAIGKSVARDVKDNPALAAGVVPGIAIAKARGKPVAPRTTRIGKGIAKQYAESYRYPIRYFQEHPGLVAMDVAAVLSGGAGAASRVGAARSAARAATGSKTRAALTRPAHEGGSLLSRPLPGRRTHYYEGEAIRGRYSQNPAAAAVQKFADKRSVARAAQTGERLTTVSGRKAARLLDEERRIRTARAQAPALRLAAREGRYTKRGKKGTLHGTIEQKAVDVVATGLTVDEHVARLHKLASEATGSTRKKLRREAALVERSREFIDEASGKPRISDRYPHLKETVAMAKSATSRTEGELERAGLLAERGAATRRNAPGRVLLGAKFVPRSLAELEGPRFNLIGKRVRTTEGMRGAIVDLAGDEASVRLWRKGNPVIRAPLDELYSASGRVREGRLVGGGRAIQIERPISPEKARTRVQELEQKVSAAEEAIAKELMARDPDRYPARGWAIRPSGPKKETRRVHEGDKGSFRHYRRRRQDPAQGDVIEPTGSSFAYAKQGKSGRELALEDARKLLERRAAAEGAHPAYRQYAKTVAELDDLKTRLGIQRDVDAGFLTDKSSLRLLYEQRAKHPNVIDTDEVRLLIPGYRNAAPEERAGLAGKYHEAASSGAGKLYDEFLAEPPAKKRVALMGGGSGAGKSTARVDPSDFDVVLDTTLSNRDSAIGKVEKALESGRDVVITYVYRDPADAYVNGVLSKGRLDSDGRVVAIDEHVRMHVDSNATIRELEKRYRGNDHVRINVVDNSKPGSPDSSVDGLPKLKYDEVDKEVRRAFEAQASRLTEAQREAALRRSGGRRARRGGEESVGDGSGGPPSGFAQGADELDEFPFFGTESDAVGAVPFTGGDFYLPEFRRSKPPKSGMLGWRGGIPRKPGTLSHSYTGSLRASGNVTDRPLRALAENLVEKERYLDAERHRLRVAPMGQKARPMDTRKVKYAPVRERPLTPKEADLMRRAMTEVDFGAITPDDASRLDALLGQFRERLFPEREYATVPPGTEIPGIVWVDKRLIANQRKIIGSLGPLDTVQDAAKGLILYAKPGYVTPNVLGNAGMNIIQQGFLAPANWRRAVKMGDELGYQVDSLMGHGYAAALAAGTRSPISAAVTTAADFWSRFVDIPFRRAAWSHEARRRGFKSQEAQRALIEDSRFADELGEITQRARDAIVDYERMGAVERDVVRRVLFVYPWVKGSTYYAVQFFRDHPVQAVVFAAIAQEGSRRSAEELGPLPAWARGSFKVGEKDGTPFIVNPNAISPFSTPASVLATARGGFGQVERSENVGEMTAPVFQAGVEAAFGRDLFTGRELEGGYGERFVKQLGKGLPQVTYYRRLTHEPKEGAAYPYGPLSATGQFVLGSSSPRPVNLQTLNEQAAGGVDPARRIRRESARERQAVLSGLRQRRPELLRENPGLAKRVETAYSRKLDVDLMRREVEQKIKEPGLEREREKLRRETALLRSWGVLSPTKASEIMGAARNGSLDDVRSWRDTLREEGFENEYLALLREAREAAGVEP